MIVQAHENLILDGKEISMIFCSSLPDNDPKIVELEVEEGGLIKFNT